MLSIANAEDFESVGLSIIKMVGFRWRYYSTGQDCSFWFENVLSNVFPLQLLQSDLDRLYLVTLHFCTGGCRRFFFIPNRCDRIL